METPTRETWDVEERAAGEGGRKGSEVQRGALFLLFIGLSWRDRDPWRSCKGRAQMEGDIAGTGKRK